MGQLDAGLPKRDASVNLPIGANLPIPSDNYLQTQADGSVWLRSGLVLPATAYPEAAKVAHLKAHIFTQTPSTAPPGPILGLATNGTGTFVAVQSGDTTNFYVSTDHGVTWTLRAHGVAGGVYLNSIVWNGARFVAVGNDAITNLFASTSTDGITWTGYTIATVAAQPSAGQADIDWNGTAFVAIVPGDTTSSIYSSTTGLSGSWTVRTCPSGIGNGSKVGGGPLGFLCTNGSSSVGYKSTDNGASWSNVTLGSNAVLGSKPMVGANFAAHFIGANQVGYSTDLTTFSQANVSIGSVGLQNTLVNRCVGSAWCVPVTAGIAHTTDGVNWTLAVEATDSFAYSLHTLSARLPCIGGSSIVQAANYGTVKPQYALSTPSRSNGVGGSGSTGMWRIK